MATGAYWLPLWKRQVYYMCARDRPIKTYKSTDKVGSQSIYTTPVKFKKKKQQKNSADALQSKVYLHNQIHVTAHCVPST